MEHEPKETEFNLRLREWQQAQSEVEDLVEKWGTELRTAISDRMATKGISQKFLPRIEEARAKADKAFDVWLASIRNEMGEK